ncbi:MAG: hypothetical protein FD175_2473 [Beijerinckiaceae bacterium]|nr:MAG: hypothetical protein FD175_2473 [Beijerinckiaceae bacterium]
MSDLSPPPAMLVAAAMSSHEPLLATSVGGADSGIGMQIARPGHFAEREELDSALKTNTADALSLFIERHPDSRYRPEAEAALKRLGVTPPSR